jgi:hypothetical protein
MLSNYSLPSFFDEPGIGSRSALIEPAGGGVMALNVGRRHTHGDIEMSHTHAMGLGVPRR